MILDHWPLVLAAIFLLTTLYLYGRIHAVIAPKLDIIAGTDPMRGRHIRGEQGGYPQEIHHTLLLEIKNVTWEQQNNCRIVLEDFTNEEGWPTACDDFPYYLRRSDGFGPFSLAAQESKWAIIASAQQDQGYPPVMLRFNEERDGENLDMWYQLDRGPYIATVAVYSDRTACRKRFKIFFNDRNALSMVQVK